MRLKVLALPVFFLNLLIFTNLKSTNKKGANAVELFTLLGHSVICYSILPPTTKPPETSAAFRFLGQNRVIIIHFFHTYHLSFLTQPPFIKNLLGYNL
jgi:hypothetical protein